MICDYPWRKDVIFHNNKIELYHDQLKLYYFGRTRNIHMDRMIYIISQVILLTINKILYMNIK